jgi:hypothetical protein
MKWNETQYLHYHWLNKIYFKDLCIPTEPDFNWEDEIQSIILCRLCTSFGNCGDDDVALIGKLKRLRNYGEMVAPMRIKQEDMIFRFVMTKKYYKCIFCLQYEIEKP